MDPETQPSDLVAVGELMNTETAAKTSINDERARARRGSRLLSPTLQAINAWQPLNGSYGYGDCCQFAAHVVKYMTGRDLLLPYEGKAGAQRLIVRYGGLSGVVTAATGLEPVELDELEAGDPVLWRSGELEGVGILMARHVAAVQEVGAEVDTPVVISLPTSIVVHGWPVHRLEGVG